jgi:nascent polypeptide-associated complex subunit alpha
LKDQQSEIDAEEVLIKTKDQVYRFTRPQVISLNMGGIETYQIIGTPVIGALARDAASEEEEAGDTIMIPQADIEMVAQQAGVDNETAKKALEKSGGDLAEAIIGLTTGS